MYDPYDPDRPNVLAGLRIDRAGRHRRDDAWLSARQTAPEARTVLIWRDQTVVVPMGAVPSSRCWPIWPG
ncbi:hypothetical protein ACFQ4K_08520 [Tistrella bauzanensis]